VSLDDEGAEELSSGEVAFELQRRARAALEANGHQDCGYLDRARYVPDAGAMVCGCGEFVEAPAQSTGTEAAPAGQLEYVARDPIEATLALIDPTEDYTPDQVERHILDTLYRLETGALFERETIRRAYQAQQDFDRAYFRAYHGSNQSSEGKRKAEAMVACEQLLEVATEAKMLKDAAKSTMHNLRAVLSGYQSTLKSIMATYNAGGSPGRPPY
jgi:hypothetical protein